MGLFRNAWPTESTSGDQRQAASTLPTKATKSDAWVFATVAFGPLPQGGIGCLISLAGTTWFSEVSRDLAHASAQAFQALSIPTPQFPDPYKVANAVAQRGWEPMGLSVGADDALYFAFRARS